MFEPHKSLLLKPGDHWIEVTLGGAGYFAVEMWLNNMESDSQNDMFPEPWNSGIGRYKTEAEAAVEAYFWAEAEGLPYKLKISPGHPDFDSAYRRMLETL